MGMIKSKSIIPHSPTDYGPLPTPHHSGATNLTGLSNEIPMTVGK